MAFEGENEAEKKAKAKWVIMMKKAKTLHGLMANSGFFLETERLRTFCCKTETMMAKIQESLKLLPNKTSFFFFFSKTSFCFCFLCFICCSCFCSGVFAVVMIIIIQRSNFVLNELMRRYLKGAGDGDEETVYVRSSYGDTFFPPCFFGQKREDILLFL